MLFLKRPLILPFLCHKSATAWQIDSNKVSNCKLKLDVCSRVKTQLLHSSHTKGAQILGHPICIRTAVPTKLTLLLG